MGDLQALSGLFECSEHLSENRGVPGSSPGLAIARKAPWMLDLAVSRVLSAIPKKGIKRGRSGCNAGNPA
jgi:hypothetical protein